MLDIEVKGLNTEGQTGRMSEWRKSRHRIHERRRALEHKQDVTQMMAV